MADYPSRARFFAGRFVRTLTKSAAAQEIGPEACWLLTVIAHQEDRKYYEAPVTFYNEQLMPLLGIGGRDRLERVRAKAVGAGWLHYEEGRKGVPGKYWVTVPRYCERLSDDPCDESDSVLNQDGNAIFHPESGRQPGRQPGGNQDGKPASSIPMPKPKPASCSEPSPTSPEPAAGFAPFPVVGKEHEWILTADRLAEYQEAFPYLDVPLVLKQARLYLMNNAAKRKTYRGMPRFCFGWLSREQNNGRGNRNGQQTAPPPKPLSRTFK